MSESLNILSLQEVPAHPTSQIHIAFPLSSMQRPCIQGECFKQELSVTVRIVQVEITKINPKYFVLILMYHKLIWFRHPVPEPLPRDL